MIYPELSWTRKVWLHEVKVGGWVGGVERERGGGGRGGGGRGGGLNQMLSSFFSLTFCD